MKRKEKKSVNRRDFLKEALRNCAVCGIGALSYMAVSKGKKQDMPLQSCLNSGICSSCRAFRGCALPQALSRKKAQRNSEG
jgi:hypothetical protein